MCSRVINYLGFVVLLSCPPNSDVCRGLENMHDNVVSENYYDVCLALFM